MFHTRDYLLPHNHAARLRGMLNDAMNTIDQYQHATCGCHGGGSNCDDEDDHPPPPPPPPPPPSEEKPPGAFLVGVTQGSSVTIGSDGVFIAKKRMEDSPSASRILAAWDADGLALERIDDLGNVPDPQANGTMTVSYDTPMKSLHFRFRDGVGELNDLVLGRPVLAIAVLPVRPATDVVRLDNVEFATNASLPAVRCPGQRECGFTVILHGVPSWASAATFGFRWSLTTPTPVELVWTVLLTFPNGQSAEGSVRFGKCQHNARTTFTSASAGFVLGADACRRPRCPSTFGCACLETVTVRIRPMGHSTVDEETHVYIAGMAFVLHPH